MATARAVLESEIAKLKGNNDYLARQIQFLAQRLEDTKKILADNVDTITNLQMALMLDLKPDA